MNARGLLLLVACAALTSSLATAQIRGFGRPRKKVKPPPRMEEAPPERAPTPPPLHVDAPAPALLQAQVIETADGTCTVEVRNPLDVPAEPLGFRLAWTGDDGLPRELDVDRVPGPHVLRLGRPAAPGARERYALSPPLPAAVLRRATTSVRTALFFPSPPALVPAPRVGGLAVGPEGDHVLVENDSDLTLDVVLQVATAAPDATALFALRLEPRERRAWTVPYSAPEWSGPHGRAVRVRAVDHCARLAPDGEEARAALEDRARSALQRGLESFLAADARGGDLCGTFTFDASRADGGASAVGRFRLEGGELAWGAREPLLDEADGELLRDGLVALLAHDAPRPAVHDMVDAARPALFAATTTSTTLAVEALPVLGLDGPGLVGLETGRIAWTTTTAEDGRPVHVLWSYRTGTAPLLHGRDVHVGAVRSPVRPARRERWDHQDRRGAALPAEWRCEERDGEGALLAATRVSVGWVVPVASLPAGSDGPAWELGGGLAPAEGTDVDALRAAWEAPLRMSAGTRSGRVEVLTDAPRPEWGHRPWTAGAFELRDAYPGGWRALTLVVEEAPPEVQAPEEGAEEGAGEDGAGAATPEDPPARKKRKRKDAEEEPPPPEPVPLDVLGRIGAARDLEQRLGAWARRDFAQRPDFDVLFAGARVRHFGEDFVLERCPVRRVRVQGGVPVLLVAADGTETHLAYGPAGGTPLPVEVRQGADVTRAVYARFPAGVFPLRLDLSGPGGDAPETLLFEGWR